MTLGFGTSGNGPFGPNVMVGTSPFSAGGGVGRVSTLCSWAGPDWSSESSARTITESGVSTVVSRAAAGESALLNGYLYVEASI